MSISHVLGKFLFLLFLPSFFSIFLILNNKVKGSSLVLHFKIMFKYFGKFLLGQELVSYILEILIIVQKSLNR